MRNAIHSPEFAHPRAAWTTHENESSWAGQASQHQLAEVRGVEEFAASPRGSPADPGLTVFLGIISRIRSQCGLVPVDDGHIEADLHARAKLGGLIGIGVEGLDGPFIRGDIALAAEGHPRPGLLDVAERQDRVVLAGSLNTRRLLDSVHRTFPGNANILEHGTF